MDYKKLASEYFTEATILNSYIKNLKREVKNKNAHDLNELNYRISLLYQMYLELKHTGEYLNKCRRDFHNVK